MVSIDVLTLGAGGISFIVFLLIHLITFRWVRPEQLLKSLFACLIVLMALPVSLMMVFFNLKLLDLPLSGWLLAAALAMMIQGLLSGFYVLCIFGPYETSVRMRLVREIAKGQGKGISLKGILAHYNAETIVKIRLQRLMGSGDIIEKNGKYRVFKMQNLFFIFDAIGNVLKKWIGR